MPESIPAQKFMILEEGAGKETNVLSDPEERSPRKAKGPETMTHGSASKSLHKEFMDIVLGRLYCEHGRSCS